MQEGWEVDEVVAGLAAVSIRQIRDEALSRGGQEHGLAPDGRSGALAPSGGECHELRRMAAAEGRRV